MLKKSSLPINLGLSVLGGITFLLFFVFIFAVPASAQAPLTSHTYYLHQDFLGSVVTVTDETGAPVKQSKFAPYGKVEAVNTAINNRTERGYTGQIKDEATTLSYYNARYYDPVLSRFISPDSLSDGLNLYAYVGGDPVNADDPTGHRRCRGQRNCPGSRFWLKNRDVRRTAARLAFTTAAVNYTPVFNGTVAYGNNWGSPYADIAPDWAGGQPLIPKEGTGKTTQSLGYIAGGSLFACGVTVVACPFALAFSALSFLMAGSTQDPAPVYALPHGYFAAAGAYELGTWGVQSAQYGQAWGTEKLYQARGVIATTSQRLQPYLYPPLGVTYQIAPPASTGQSFYLPPPTVRTANATKFTLKTFTPGSGTFIADPERLPLKSGSLETQYVQEITPVTGQGYAKFNLQELERTFSRELYVNPGTEVSAGTSGILYIYERTRSDYLLGLKTLPPYRGGIDPNFYDYPTFVHYLGLPPEPK